MPLLIELPEASVKVANKYMKPVTAEEKWLFGPNLGDFFSTGSAETDEFFANIDGDPVVKHFQNMTINAGHTVRPSARCKGMYILVEGDLTINGTLTMTARGAVAPSKYVGILPSGEEVYFATENTFVENPDIIVLEKEGGLGGASVTLTASTSSVVTKHGLVGQSKVRGSGGGGSGGIQNLAPAGTGTKRATSASGLVGSVFAGGSGGGGAAGRACNITAPAPSSMDTIGIGGNGAACAGAYRGKAGATGGAGPAGPGTKSLQTYSTDGSVTFDSGYGNGSGGLLIILVKGNIHIAPTGKISSEGVRAPGVSAANTATIGTGGGSGGGIVMIFHKGSVTNEGVISVAGGPGGVGPGGDGGAGGAGHQELIAF